MDNSQTTDHLPYLRFEFPDRHGTSRPLCFTNPLQVIQAHEAEAVCSAIQAVENAIRDGYYAAGFISYEAAPAFDPLYATKERGPLPLIWFGVFDAPLTAPAPFPPGSYRLGEWTPSVSEEVFHQDIARIKDAIALGETYQVNYTLRLRAQFAGDDYSFYRALTAVQRGAYSAYLHLGRFRLLSASPELFFRLQGDRIVTRPMKGTCARGRWLEEDALQRRRLEHSAKERAENVMIVDLLRNDLSRIARPGTVQVDHLCALETYPTVHQLTSTVSAELRPDVSLLDLLSALFPSGSITGAPKISTMRKIAELETTARGVYCGAIGWITPHREATFSVAIRTVTLDSETGVAEYGTGGGVTWDSLAGEEYREALVKARILTEVTPAFSLLETLRLEQGHYHLLERHLHRLRQSAQYYQIALDETQIRAELAAHAHAGDGGVRRVRLLVSQDGAVRVESMEMPATAMGIQSVTLAREPISKSYHFYCHKTTQRSMYDLHRKAAPASFDVLLWNEDREITEFTMANLVAEIAGQKLTPARACGLLAGTLRQELLESGEIREAVITFDDLRRASHLWWINSVRGWVPAALDSPVDTL